MELESKARINYPHLLQEHSFKRYISDHNLWGLCFLHLLRFHKHTHTQWESTSKHLIFTRFDMTNVIREGVLICDFCNWLITLMSIAIHNGRWWIRRGLLVSESDPLTEEERQKETDRKRMPLCWSTLETKLMNLMKVETVSHNNTCRTVQWNKGCVNLSKEAALQILIILLTRTKWKKWHGWSLRSEVSNSGCRSYALVSEENKRGWEKWASRCDSLFLRPPSGIIFWRLDCVQLSS